MREELASLGDYWDSRRTWGPSIAIHVFLQAACISRFGSDRIGYLFLRDDA